MKSRELLVETYIPILIFSLLCLTSIGLANIAGLTILFSILYLVIENKIKKGSGRDIGFIFRNIWPDIKKFWWLILLPVVSGFISLFLSKILVPGFIPHILERTSPMLLLDRLPLLIPQLLLLAFGEEIAFRAFFQTKIGRLLPPVWAIVLTSLLFAAGHFSAGPAVIVFYDLLFIFIDSVLYGLIFKKTGNVFTCTISHFLANLVSICLLLFM